MESGEVNAKRGCGRGAAVEQLTSRGMEYQSPRWGVIVDAKVENAQKILSIPAMGGNSEMDGRSGSGKAYQSPRWGAIECRAFSSG